ncbi:gas vesicle protein [Microtetraspora sp. NBRC 13810]|uniref:GvpL/GvpF family gas vesicle protein n=1 Tax=Microtetraspora sp. NBRC 13810 TaxID=3030990 RepID=UPI0024A3F34E|nr:GvpL/GvpF family gas vesicle protein [Microtetraspora sp. NBRC 13810]GLW11957.1 gas vesicle protein [Microtetraspora sp. NBRC 13810]
MTAETSETVRQSTGSYIYGILPEDVEVSSDATGVGDPPARVTLVRHGEIAALVSDVGLDRPLGTPGDLVAHERLLDATAAEVPVLPIRFGAVMTNADAVVAELLEPFHDEFRSALEDLEGRAQYVVKGRYVEQVILREVLAEDPEAGRLSQTIRGRPEDATRDERIRLGELINQAIGDKREADTQTMVEELAGVCELVVIRDPSHERDAVHAAVLIEVDRQDELEQVVAEFADEWSGRVEFSLRGPMAAYDFVMNQGEVED